MHASQNLVQAIPPGGSPLLQLPFFTPKIVQAVEGNNRNHISVQEYMRLPADRRKKLVVGPGLLTERQYQIAMTTAQQLPAIKVEKIFFKVRGEKVTTPNSLVQLIVKFRFVPPGTTNLPAVDPKDLVQADEDDKEEAKRFTPALAHAPFFARDHSPVWHVFLGDSRMGRIAVPPFTYSTFDKPIFTDEGEPTFNVQTIKMQFGAPPQEGRYTFVLHLINDSYVGLDVKEYVTMVVEDVSNAEVIEDEGEISEPDQGMCFF
jgi:translocation protein SEC63